jgi:hypothetical protein
MIGPLLDKTTLSEPKAQFVYRGSMVADILSPMKSERQP